MAEHDGETRKLGMGMLIGGWIVLLVLIASLFDNRLAQLFNPNQQLLSEPLPAGNREVTLLPNRLNHYVFTARVNAQDVVMMVDTGATHVAIPETVATRLGLPRGRSYWVNTANGRSRVYDTVLDELAIGPIRLYNVTASITPGLDGEVALLGMSALKQLQFSRDGDRLLLRQ